MGLYLRPSFFIYNQTSNPYRHEKTDHRHRGFVSLRRAHPRGVRYLHHETAQRRICDGIYRAFARVVAHETGRTAGVHNQHIPRHRYHSDRESRPVRVDDDAQRHDRQTGENPAARDLRPVAPQQIHQDSADLAESRQLHTKLDSFALRLRYFRRWAAHGHSSSRCQRHFSGYLQTKVRDEQTRLSHETRYRRARVARSTGAIADRRGLHKLAQGKGAEQRRSRGSGGGMGGVHTVSRVSGYSGAFGESVRHIPERKRRRLSVAGTQDIRIRLSL